MGAKSAEGVCQVRWVEPKMTCAEVQANYPTAGEIHSIRGRLEPAKFHRSLPLIRVDRPRAAAPFFDE